jgi:hypothetical protein
MTARSLMVAVSVAALMGWAAGSADAQQVSIGATDIGGIVTGPNGPEAGVWVIVETNELGTRYAKSVVTDDQGRYVMPDLPKANYDIWVRGYGLVDSPKAKAAPGQHLDLKAVAAPDEKAAAQYYPAAYWLAMLKIPPVSDFPGNGKNGIGPLATTQGNWLDKIKSNGCVGCHQLGNKATRTLSPALGQFDSDHDAWIRRVQSGQASETMVTQIQGFGGDRVVELFADWTTRIAQGELPKTKPPRPQGLERNVVVTVWDWGAPTHYLHDEIATDRRNPTLNGYGKLYGSPELSTDLVPVLDPKTHTVSEFKMPVRDPKTPTTKNDPMFAPSPYWGDERIWDSQTVIHNPMMDAKGRVWFTSRVRPAETPAFCQAGSDHPSAKATPVKTSGRQLAMYDPKTDKITLVNTCFGTHHIAFAEDGHDTMWFSSGGAGDVVGWFSAEIFDETGDEAKAQGWTALVLDTNGNGKRDAAFVGAKDPVDPTKDKLISGSYYAVAYSPLDGSIWGSMRGYPGAFVRLAPGSNPPETALAEYYELPANNPKAQMEGYGPRGMDIDRNGVVWAGLNSGQLVSFDRRKCTGPLNGPTATGQHCPEGFSFYPMPGPQFDGVADKGSVESSYYTWVDQHNTLGLGDNVPVLTGNEMDGLIAFNPKDGKYVMLRVPYPMGFYAKGLDGRIDDANAGWKGRGLWSTSGNRTPFHNEGGKGAKPNVIHVQLRPDPLAH